MRARLLPRPGLPNRYRARAQFRKQVVSPVVPPIGSNVELLATPPGRWGVYATVASVQEQAFQRRKLQRCTGGGMKETENQKEKEGMFGGIGERHCRFPELETSFSCKACRLGMHDLCDWAEVVTSPTLVSAKTMASLPASHVDFKSTAPSCVPSVYRSVSNPTPAPLKRITLPSPPWPWPQPPLRPVPSLRSKPPKIPSSLVPASLPPHSLPISSSRGPENGPTST